MSKKIKRSELQILKKRFNEKRRFIQIITGPRQIGKTTLALQLIDELNYPIHYVTADIPSLKELSWIDEQFETIHLKMRASQKGLLIFDEIQKINNWEESIKSNWEKDTKNKINLHVLLLGSSPTLMQKGTESLMGRFEVIRMCHWSYKEMNNAFGWKEEKYIVYGGYPGATSLTNNFQRWRLYILNSIIEPTLSKDILFLENIRKPALLKQVCELGALYSSQILSYTKMLGQLHDVGNTVTVAHYLNLLSKAGIITGLSKFSKKEIKKQSSSPKLQVLNTAFITSYTSRNIAEAKSDKVYWGHLVESAVGSHLINQAIKYNGEVYYWRDGNYEVDFILVIEGKAIAIEVKSNYKRPVLYGMEMFSKKYHVYKKMLIGGDGISICDFLNAEITELI